MVSVMQTPDNADSSAENRQGTKMKVPLAPEIGLLAVIESHYSIDNEGVPQREPSLLGWQIVRAPG